MKRKIISIDEEKCTGCGQCIPDCPEGALQIIDGKARLVSDLFCDGLGACMGTCPEAAISVIEREAGAYDEKAVMANVARGGPNVIRAHLEHLLKHGERDLYAQAISYLAEHHIPVPEHVISGVHPCHEPHPRSSFSGCPGAAGRTIPRQPAARSLGGEGSAASGLRQWPVQLALLDPRSTFFENADILIVADCVPLALAGLHRDYLKNRIVIMFCPKLDPDIPGYIDKLTGIFTSHGIRSVTILHMEVPCCSGVTRIVNQAIRRSGKNIPEKEVTVTIGGDIAA